jgi:enediyne biosynthesis protein E4
MNRRWFIRKGAAAATMACLKPPGLFTFQTAPARTAKSAGNIQFEEIATKSGVGFITANSATPNKNQPETMVAGVALLDYDGDGRLDVYAVQGGTFPPDPEHPNSGDRLFRNRGDGTFEDVSERAGIAAMTRGYGHAVAVADYDNDVHPDLFVKRW